jgi:hypothetical protein
VVEQDYALNISGANVSLDGLLKNLRSMSKRFDNMQPLFRRIANSFWQRNRQTIFPESGGLNTAFFPDLAEATIADKPRRLGGINVYPILSRSGQRFSVDSLRESLIKGSNPHSIFRMTAKTMQIGTSNEKAYASEYFCKVPRRAVDLNRYPLERWARWAGEYAVSGEMR